MPLIPALETWLAMSVTGPRPSTNSSTNWLKSVMGSRVAMKGVYAHS
jgi:hypothetical protein